MIPKEKHPRPWRFHPRVALIIILLGGALTVPLAAIVYAFREYKKSSDTASLTANQFLATAKSNDLLWGVLEKSAGIAPPQPLPLQNYVEIPVSASAFPAYREHCERLASQLGSQIATLISMPGSAHLILRLPAASKNSVVESLVTGRLLDASVFPKPIFDDSILDIVVQEYP